MRTLDRIGDGAVREILMSNIADGAVDGGPRRADDRIGAPELRRKAGRA